MVMCGPCYSQNEAGVENGPTALACFAALLVVASDGSGTQKIMSGPRFTRSSRSDGCMSMLARKLGITQGYIPRVRIPPCYLLRQY